MIIFTNMNSSLYNICDKGLLNTFYYSYFPTENVQCNTMSVAQTKYNELQEECEEFKTLASSRLNEIELLQKTLEERAEDIEKFKLQVSFIT